MTSALRAAACSILDWVYPRHCCHCEGPVLEPGLNLLCAHCAAQMRACRVTGPVCMVCGIPLAGPIASDTPCTGCRAQRRHFDRARAAFVYTGPVVSLIREFKFHGSYCAGPCLLRDELLEHGLPEDLGKPDAVVPLPLHPRRRRERGYDQARLLADEMAAYLGLRTLRGALVRTRYTAQQSLLPVTQRWDNVRGAFAVSKPHLIRGRSVLLVDDVVTTGVTVDECARVLKRAGAAGVQVLSLARTPP